MLPFNDKITAKPILGTGNILTVLYAKPIWLNSYTLFLEVNVLVE